MTSLAEQLSTVRKFQWNAQLDLLNRLGTRTIDSTEQLIELNIKTSRASLEQAASTVKQLLAVRDAHDLFALGAHAQNPWQQLFSYGRELMGIASSARDGLPVSLPFSAQTLPLLPAPNVNLPLTPYRMTEQAAIAVADATTIASEIAGAAADIGSAVAEATLDAGTRAAPDVAPAAASIPAPAAKAVPDAVAAAGEAASAAVSDSVSDAVSAAESVANTVVAAVTEPATESAADPAPLHAAVDVAAAAAPVVVAVEAQAAGSAQHVAEAVLDHAIAEAAPPGKAKTLVEALHDATHTPAGIAHPLAATVPLDAVDRVELPIVTPAEPTPAAPSQGPAPAGRERRTGKRK